MLGVILICYLCQPPVISGVIAPSLVSVEAGSVTQYSGLADGASCVFNHLNHEVRVAGYFVLGPRLLQRLT